MARKKARNNPGQWCIIAGYSMRPQLTPTPNDTPEEKLFTIKKYLEWRVVRERFLDSKSRVVREGAREETLEKRRESRRRRRREMRLRLSTSGQQDGKPQAENINNTACHQVFATTELAETVFLELGMSDILCGVIQTSKNWNTVVENSLKLQQALFFKPIPIAPLRFSFERKGWVTTENGPEHHVYEHPLLEKLNNLAVEKHISASLAGEMRMSPELVLESVKKHALATWKSMGRPDASWRRALMSQPPIAHVHTAGDGESHLIAENETGVIMEDVIPVVRAKGCRSWNFRKPALKLRGYNKMAYYEGYAQLEELLEAEKSKKLKA